jgi:DNA-binding transcriptional LysR family regulator
MDDLNDLMYFAAVVQHGGFSAAARALGIEKTRLSRRLANLERRLGVRLLNRTTRSIALTEAGAKFNAHCLATVEGARSAYESVAEMRREPAGMVRMTSPQVLAQSYLAPLLPAYLSSHPKVRLEIDATDRNTNFFDDRFDLALHARPQIDDSTGLVARELGRASRVLVGSPLLLQKIGRPALPVDLERIDTIGRPGDVQDGRARWILSTDDGRKDIVAHQPRMMSDDLRLQLEAAVHGIGIALLPEPIVAAAVRRGELERVLSDWVGATHLIFLLYPKPRGMLPSVRSVIDYLAIHLPATIQERSLPLE